MTVAPPLAPPHDLDSEQSVLGAALLSPAVLPVLAGDIGLRPEHFYRERHQHIYAAMLALDARSITPDTLTVTGELRDRGQLADVGGQAAIDTLTASVPAAGNARHYAQRVVDEAVWRQALQASLEIQIAVQHRDRDELDRGEAKLAQRDRPGERRTFTPGELADRVWDRLAHPDQAERFPWPFRKLNALTRGGMARGQVTVIAGPTSHGKSVLCDMALESGGVRQNVDAHLFLNEMTEEERTSRTLGRQSGVPWGPIFDRKLEPEQKSRVADALSKLRFGITEAAGWTAQDICREARRRRYDLLAVDLVQKLPSRSQNRVAELEDASNQFNALAKDTGCHVLLVAHLNRSRVGSDGRRPVPTVTDIKGCQALVDDADNALYVWREQDDENGDPLKDGFIRFAKARGGELGGLPVEFDGELMRFDPAGDTR